VLITCAMFSASVMFMLKTSMSTVTSPKVTLSLLKAVVTLLQLERAASSSVASVLLLEHETSKTSSTGGSGGRLGGGGGGDGL